MNLTRSALRNAQFVVIILLILLVLGTRSFLDMPRSEDPQVSFPIYVATIVYPGTGPEDIALDAIREVGSSGHYFGIEHTQERYETAFYQPFVSDWRNFEAFALDNGGVWTAQRAHLMFKDIINELRTFRVGDTIVLEVDRDGAALVFDVVLGERPEDPGERPESP